MRKWIMTYYNLPNGPNCSPYYTVFGILWHRVRNDCKSQKHFIFSDKASILIFSINGGDLTVSVCDKKF
ncbi:hypothetical protein KSS87_002915, partial [Heliosperma pusillum]